MHWWQKYFASIGVHDFKGEGLGDTCRPSLLKNELWKILKKDCSIAIVIGIDIVKSSIIIYSPSLYFYKAY